MGLVPQYGVNNYMYCVLRRVKAKKSAQKHTTKSFDEFHNYSPLMTMLKYVLKYCPYAIMPAGMYTATEIQKQVFIHTKLLQKVTQVVWYFHYCHHLASDNLNPSEPKTDNNNYCLNASSIIKVYL